MMDDREMLELAAKAAKHVVEPYMPWNPLANDGDALRLAVKLGILIDVRYTDPMSQKYNSVTYWLTTSSGSQLMFGEELDPCAATRRAITRAAAEIEKGKQ